MAIADLIRRHHLIILRDITARKKCLAENPLEKETRQKVLWSFYLSLYALSSDEDPHCPTVSS